MTQAFSLAPRYRLDDESPWLLGVDPLRRYHIYLNGDPERVTLIQGLSVSKPELKLILQQVNNLQSGDAIRIPTGPVSWLDVHCVSENCFALSSSVNGADTWHLFDAEALQSLLMTSHPDWKSNMKTLELGRQAVAQAWQEPVVS